MDLTILAAGNTDLGDDGIGIYAGQLLEERGFRVIYCGVAPENFLGMIKTKKALLIDAALIEEEFVITGELEDFPSVSTHGMSLMILQKYFNENNIKLIVAGIKPENMEYGRGLSKEAKSRAKKLVDIIIKRKDELIADDS
jgi:hydrogenase maturation protease